MPNPDYSKNFAMGLIGLKVGLEIHQQLDTAKLFCNCPSIMREESPDRTIKRVLRASAGETGEIDVAAKAEIEKRKHYVYEFYDDTNCLVELDEEPPHEINKDALGVVLQFSLMVGAAPIDEVHVMRKTVVDGSNTTGFQRTALVARNGVMDVELSDGRQLKIGVETVCLEEDAARIIEKAADHDTYRLDRLGIPLIEIATGPDMHTPQEAKEVAAHIGMLLRSTGKVKRGLGTIRQDVNVSIEGGTRVEIKGVQDLRLLDKVVELEAQRQLAMLRLRDEMQERKVHADHSAPKDYSSYFTDTKSNFIKKGLDADQKLFGKPYKEFKGFFGFEVNPNRRFGSELSDRIKLLGLNGLIHTDEDLSKYKIVDEVKAIYAQLGLDDADSMIFILGSEERCIAAFKRIDDAIADFLANGLSKEVRNAKDDATSVFLRPMPGSSRMYPETDVPSFNVDMIDVKKPELIKDKVARFEKEYGLPAQVAKEVIFEDFEDYVKKYPQLKAMTIAESLSSYPREIKTLHGVDFDYEKYADAIFGKANAGEIDPSSIKEIMTAIAKGSSLDDALNAFKKADESELVSYITELISKHPNHSVQALMGEVMKKYRGKFPGARIMELLKKFKGEP